ncbi:MAG: hypothetical protein ABEJ78_11695 [Haloferacaceae archaeon]
MPSSNRSVLAASILVAVALLAYAVVVAGNVLLGVLLAAFVYLVGWVVSRLPNAVGSAFSQRRALATGLLVVLVLGYAVLVTANLLLGVVVSLTVAFVSWATIPDGPVARWLAGR